jgi:prepilin-type processing-associated H-X9-DG protein
MEMSDAMNAEKMIEYALSKPAVADIESDERGLSLDPEQRAQLARLRMAIQGLVDDGADFEPPAGLAFRTVGFVARNRRRPTTLWDQVATRLPFRWADFAVAAGIFIAGTLTLLPAIHRSRERMNQAGCVFNLQQLGNSLAQYSSMHPFLPYPPSNRSDTHAGMFAVMLHDAGVLDNLAVLDCPCNGATPGSMKDLATFEQIDRIRKTDPEAYRSMLRWDYAYNVGYRHASSGPGPLEVMHASQIPVLADQPDHQDFLTIREGNSPNHGGRGQNVLFGDGSVRWFYTRLVGPYDPDLYLNNNREPRPGVDVSDSVLMPSKVPFCGR